MKLILGTVQLGLNYGIANDSGKPSIDNSIEIIKKCLKNDINTFDTARAYGDAEDILGLFCEEQNNEINIITNLELSKNLSEKKIDEIEN